MRVLHQRIEQQVERFARLSLAVEVAGEREARAPILREPGNQAAAQLGNRRVSPTCG
jgi:hypothetical protein